MKDSTWEFEYKLTGFINIKADSREEAFRKFRNMDTDEVVHRSTSVIFRSIVCQKGLEVAYAGKKKENFWRRMFK